MFDTAVVVCRIGSEIVNEDVEMRLICPPSLLTFTNEIKLFSIIKYLIKGLK